jgi:hypothetical protein
VVGLSRPAAGQICYAHKALEESAARAEALAATGDHEGAGVWRRITAARTARKRNAVRSAALTA